MYAQRAADGADAHRRRQAGLTREVGLDRLGLARRKIDGERLLARRRLAREQDLDRVRPAGTTSSRGVRPIAPERLAARLDTGASAASAARSDALRVLSREAPPLWTLGEVALSGTPERAPQTADRDRCGPRVTARVTLRSGCAECVR